jgi:conjugative relaxase-like TrwC/TraI family protein
LALEAGLVILRLRKFNKTTTPLAIDASSRVDGALLEATLDGRIGEAQLGRQLDGQFVHAAGTDVEFQAPKSVSVMALMVDERLINAHDEAVKATLGFIESDLMGTRVRQGKDVHFETEG